MRNVDEAVILVTGATDGLGRRVARDLAEKGATVLLHGRSRERAEAAVREIEEETGIRGRVVRALGTIEYRFSADGRHIHKLVHHYLLEALGGTLTIEGDPDQEAIDVAWVPLQQLGDLLTFPNERRIAREATALLEDTA